MTRRLELIDVETGTRAVADFNWETAPVTSASMWAALEQPIEADAAHSTLVGRAVILDVPERNRVFDPDQLTPENETVTPLPGEIGLICYPAGTFADPQRPDEADGSTPYWMLTLIYGRDARFFTLLGWEPISIFAEITEGKDAFAKCLERIRSDGAKPLQLKRLED